MFGFGKRQKLYHVVLTEAELQRLKAGMSSAEKKEFERRQKNAGDRAYEDGFLDGFVAGGD